mgnify:FL=1
MAKAIRFRGPDSQGVWVDVSVGLALAHRRLSIIDVSQAGYQPMISPSGRYVIVFNGEVYNAARLRPLLQQVGYVFKGHSDTEVMLAAIEHYGLTTAVTQFIGMFAFALWDRQEQKIHLVRDRVGVKPLYYGIVEKTFFFGSQLKSFYPHPHWKAKINPKAVAEFLAYNYIPGQISIYENIRKVTPGTIVTIDQDWEISTHTYWSMRMCYETSTTLLTDDNHTIDHLHSLLRDAVQIRMTSDVPLGAFLSGGVDSSLVVALMQEAYHGAQGESIKTFTIGFEEDTFNEAQYAEAVARHLGTDHHTFYLTSKHALDIIPKIPDYFDEPFADASQIPTYLVSQMARQHIIVALSGDGGDEFFAGYIRHGLGGKWSQLLAVPIALRKVFALLPHHLAHPRYSKIIEQLLHMSHPSDKLAKFAKLLSAPTFKELFHRTYLMWDDDDLQKMTGGRNLTHFDEVWNHCKGARSLLDQMQLCDGLMYLAGDILTKVDRASMAHSLETREPLLDHRILEYAWQLPEHLKLNDGTGKIALRQVLGRYIPHQLIDRPKQGFSVPIGQWLRGPLREWAHDLLSESMLRNSGFLDVRPIVKRRNEHMMCKRDWTDSLWGVLMYQAWREASKGQG